MKEIFRKAKIHKLFKEDETRFLLGCGFKVCAIFYLNLILIFYVMWTILSINNIFFESLGFSDIDALRSAFFEFILNDFFNSLWIIFSGGIFLFFVGLYIGLVLLRPFEAIGKYSLSQVEGKDTSYNPDLFSDYRLLTRFSEIFFRYTERIKKTGEYVEDEISSQYSRIHKPVIEKVFIFHFILLLGTIGLLGAVFSVFVITDIQTKLFDLALKTVYEEGKNVGSFIENQRYVFNSLSYALIATTFTSYLLLGFHFYAKVSGAIFAFFSTMRAFMKGNVKSRVHLIGYSHIRNHGRNFNKYLNYIEREYANKKNEVK